MHFCALHNILAFVVIFRISPELKRDVKIVPTVLSLIRETGGTYINIHSKSGEMVKLRENTEP